MIKYFVYHVSYLVKISSYYLSVPTYFCYNLNTLCLKNSVGIFKCTVSVKTSLYISGQGTRAAICYINFKLPYISYLQLISIKASISECYISIKYTPVYSKLALAYFCYLWLLAIFAPIVFFLRLILYFEISYISCIAFVLVNSDIVSACPK